MHVLIGILGLITLLLVANDLLWTTFLEGAGPISRRVNRFAARRLLWIHKRGKTRRAITKTGLVNVVSTLALWSAMLWGGWAMVFNSGPRAVVFSSTERPATVSERIYFAGYTLSTLGLGEFRPLGTFWQILTAFAAGSGFVLVGLAVAYIVPVISAATQKRQVAVCIWSLGRSPDEIIMRAWNGVDTTALGPHLVQLTALLALLGESHLTYPVLHYFHSSKRSSAVAPSVAALDEALTILECGLEKGCSLDLPALGAARESISEFLRTLNPALIEAVEDAPPAPSLASLRQAGIPVVDDQLFQEAVAYLAPRRRLLLALVHNEGWRWEDVWPPDGPMPIDSSMGEFGPRQSAAPEKRLF